MNDVTRLLDAIDAGDPHAAGQLLPLVYDELRKLASQKLAQERPGQTLVPTALVHEAYLRLVGTNPPSGGRQPPEQTSQGADAHRSVADNAARSVAPEFNSRGHFFAAAAEAMRRILIENARRKRRLKHGGDRQRVDLDEACSLVESPADDLLALDDALTRLATRQPLKAEVVKLRFFAGLTMPEVARALGLSLATAERHWAYARVWLYAELTDGDDAGRNK